MLSLLIWLFASSSDINLQVTTKTEMSIVFIAASKGTEDVSRSQILYIVDETQNTLSVASHKLWAPTDLKHEDWNWFEKTVGV